MKIQSINPAFMGKNNSLRISNKKGQTSANNHPNYEISAMDALSFKGMDYIPSLNSACVKIVSNSKNDCASNYAGIISDFTNYFQTEGDKLEILDSIIKAKMTSPLSEYQEDENTSNFISTISGKDINIQKGLIDLLYWKDYSGKTNGYSLFTLLMESENRDFHIKNIGKLSESLNTNNVPAEERAQIIGNTYYKSLNESEREDLFFALTYDSLKDLSKTFSFDLSI